MPLTIRNLGEVLLHIYDFPCQASLYLPLVAQYEADTPCVVGGTENDGPSFQGTCVDNGFKNWLNVAVVSDTCDEVSKKTVSALVEAFNEDCREGCWLWKMM